MRETRRRRWLRMIDNPDAPGVATQQMGDYAVVVGDDWWHSESPEHVAIYRQPGWQPDQYDANPTVHVLTLRLLRAGGHGRLAHVVKTLGPNRAGRPMPGLLGFMRRPHLLVVLHAVDLAHTAKRSPGWPRLTLDEHARGVIERGGWRDIDRCYPETDAPCGPRWRARYSDATEAYRRLFGGAIRTPPLKEHTP